MHPYQKVIKRWVEKIKKGEVKPKPCCEKKEGQVLVKLNCKDCGYAHERWVDE